MNNPTPESFKYSAKKISEMTYWANYNGFTGETCGECKKTANVMAGGPGWFCTCGHYNLQTWHGWQMPHETPNLGPTRETIIEGHKAGKQWLTDDAEVQS